METKQQFYDYQQQFENLFVNEIRAILTFLENEGQPSYYEIIQGDKVKGLICQFKHQLTNDVLLWSDDMINFNTNDLNIATDNELADIVNNFKFDGRILTWSDDKNLNQKVLDLIGKDFVYRGLDDPAFKKLANIYYGANGDEVQLKTEIDAWKAKLVTKTNAKQMKQM